MLSFQKALSDRKEKILLRELPRIEDGIDLFSNDYLGLARSAKFKQLIELDFIHHNENNGATGSRLLSGNSQFIETVEREIAGFHKAESALIYNSGYTANLGLISSIATRDVTLIMDELCHASLIDGARLGNATKIRFKHNDPEDLREKLQKTKGETIVIVESVYSMDGDICPLKEVSQLCVNNGACLIVDEAHAVGVFGKNGEGLVGALGLEQQVMARVITYGKAPGIHGAAIVGPKWLTDYQVNFSRPFIFSTAPAPHQISAISSFYRIIPDCEPERSSLQEIIRYFLQRRKNHSSKWIESHSHIQSLIIPGNNNVIEKGKQLKDAGINALPIRKPSVPEGEERIRFCLHSYNTKDEIDILFSTLQEISKSEA